MISEIFKKLEEIFLEKFVQSSKQMQQIYNKNGIARVLSPGRINIIGEHTDYNLGYSMPMAINKYKYFVGMKNNTNNVEIYDNGFNEYYEFSLDNVVYDENVKWSNYIKGIIKEYIIAGNKISGFSIVIDSDLISGSGLSSSSALLSGTAKLLEILFEINSQKRDSMEYCHLAENNFVKLNNGYLDHFAVIYSKKDNAIFLNFKDLSYSYVPINLKKYKFLIIDSKEERYLPETDYNKRRQECNEALLYIIEISGNKFLSSLQDVNYDFLKSLYKKMPDKLFKRAKHVITENARVVKAKECLKNNDLKSLGKMMFESHDSLDKDYEVSTEKLNFLVNYCKDTNETLGARLMGAGFGGCIVSLVEDFKIQNFSNEITIEYEKKFELKPIFIECVSSDGTKEIN